jgi:hypothetical protein
MKTPSSPHRSDKGLILATPRDLFILAYIAHHWVVRYDHLKHLLSQQAGGPTKDPDSLADSTVKDQIERWVRAGWIVYERVLAGERGYAYCTRKGLRMVGLEDLYDQKPPSALRYHHYWAVSDVRLFWWEGESEKDQGVWIPERRLRAEMTSAKKIDPDHYFAPIRIFPGPVPDAVVSGNGWCDAIEVQLSGLKPGEMDKKMAKLARATYRDVQTDKEYIYNDIHVYVPSESLKRSVERSVGKLSQSDQERFNIVVDPDYARFKGR